MYCISSISSQTGIITRRVKETKKHLTCCTSAQEVGSGLNFYRVIASVQFETYKRTRGKMKYDTDSQERQRTVISRSTVEFMTLPIPPPPPKKKRNKFKDKGCCQKLMFTFLLCWSCSRESCQHIIREIPTGAKFLHW